jgi:DNA invertase Pin-like site-specific DNA recombinase
MTVPKRAAIYCCVSTMEQNTERQETELREIADRRG